MNKEKLEIIHSWVSANVEEPCEISVASNDASFRSYWRLSFDNDTKILMHAPPKLEPLESFLDINIRLGSIGINVPKILKTDKSKGFILMSDLGNKKYLDVLNDDTVYCLYTDAIDAICKMQKEASTENLKTFDIEEQRLEIEIIDGIDFKASKYFDVSINRWNLDKLVPSVLEAHRRCKQLKQAKL